MSAVKLLTNESVDYIDTDDTSSGRQFKYAVDGTIENDQRKITALYFTVPDSWNAQWAGGVRIKTSASNDEGSENEDGNEIPVEAKRDRLLIFRSDTCLHKMEGWLGGEGSDMGSHIVTHFV